MRVFGQQLLLPAAGAEVVKIDAVLRRAAGRDIGPAVGVARGVGEAMVGAHGFDRPTVGGVGRVHQPGGGVVQHMHDAARLARHAEIAVGRMRVIDQLDGERRAFGREVNGAGLAIGDAGQVVVANDRPQIVDRLVHDHRRVRRTADGTPHELEFVGVG